jgi:hypothetical protein
MTAMKRGIKAADVSYRRKKYVITHCEGKLKKEKSLTDLYPRTNGMS